MAEQPVNAVITRIDAPFPEQWREGLFEFTKELGAIKELLGVMAIGMTESKEAQKSLADLYTKESVAQRASQAIIEEQPQQRVMEGLRPVGASQALPRLTAFDQLGRPISEEPGAPPPAPPTGDGKGSGGPSRPPNPNEKFFLENPLALPQHYGGQYTATDLINLMARLTNHAGWEGGTEKLIGLSKAMPQIQGAFGLIGQYTGLGSGSPLEWLNNTTAYSRSLGYQPGEGGLNQLHIGPFGFRTPFNSGALSGVGNFFNAFGTAMATPGLSTQDAIGLQQSLAERGWYPGQPQTDELFNAQVKLFSRGGPLQELATNPDLVEMMDKAMRSGSASIKEITKMVEEVPDAAKTAHVGMTQMMADMKAFGELSESQGGTIFGGAQQAQELATTTGMPASASMGLLNNPWTQSMIFRETGVPSWMQGGLPGSVKTAAAQKAFWQAARAVGRPKALRYKDINGGEGVYSGISQQAAMMKKLPGFESMSIEQIERRLRGGSNWGSALQDRTKTMGALGNWRHDALAMLKEGVNPEKVNKWISGGEEGQMPGGFGHLLSEMREQMTPDGRHRYSQEDIRKIREAGQGKHGEDLVQAKYRAVQEIIQTKADKQSKNQEGESSVMIELSPAARKFLQLPNKKSQQKLSTNAGSGEPLNHAYTGYTDPLSPTVPRFTQWQK